MISGALALLQDIPVQTPPRIKGAVQTVKKRGSVVHGNVYQLSLPLNVINLDKQLCLVPNPHHVRHDWFVENSEGGHRFLVDELVERFRIYRQKVIKDNSNNTRFHRARYRAVFSMLLANLWHAYVHDSQLIIKRETAHKADLDSNPERISNKLVAAAAEFLADLQLITYAYGSEGIVTGGSASWAAADFKLVALLQKEQARIRLHERADLVILRDADGKNKPLPKDKNLAKLIRDLEASVANHNRVWLDHYATLDGGSLIIDLKRVFNKTLYLNGRFYGSFQNIPSADRQRILIDGERTVELDFKSMHFAILYAWEGIQLTDDPYQLEGVDRNTAKAAALRLLNSENLAGFKASITASGNPTTKAAAERYARELAIHDIRKAKGLHSKAPRKPPSLESFIKGIATGTRGEDVLQAILERHRPIARHIGDKDIGLRLQHTDALIMAGALSRLQGIPVLPVHDSIRCRVSDSGAVMNAMQAAYREVTGFDARIELKQERKPSNGAV